MEEYYRLLGLKRGAGRPEVKKAARRLFLQHHPDLNPGRREQCEEITKQLIEAYRRLMDSLPEEAGSPAREAPPEDAPPGPEAVSDELECMEFVLNKRNFALPMRCIREVIRIKDVRIEEASIISDTFPWLVGLFHRGNDVALLWNLHGQLGLREPDMDSGFIRRKIILVDVNDSPAGFIVDDIGGITVFSREDIAEPSGDQSGLDPGYIEGVIQRDEERVLLLNLGNLVYNFTV